MMNKPQRHDLLFRRSEFHNYYYYKQYNLKKKKRNYKTRTLQRKIRQRIGINFNVYETQRLFVTSHEKQLNTAVISLALPQIYNETLTRFSREQLIVFCNKSVRFFFFYFHLFNSCAHACVEKFFFLCIPIRKDKQRSMRINI